MRAIDSTSGSTRSPAWSVSGLLLAVADAVASRLGATAVHGELSGFTRAASGHCYFTLKDSDGHPALLRCAMFRRAASLVDFQPADGQQVEIRGRVTVYESRGELQCVVESMHRLGAGTLYELFLRLKARLDAAGLFDPLAKRPLPAYPAALGLVTSLGAAALHDVITAIGRRAPHVRIVVYPCAVQGAEAPAQIVQALEAANRRAEVDALIVCRGGGSMEDLWAFNDEQVVRAIVASHLPVVCGVGHETDVTLAELAADVRAPTPTAAAELATPVRADEISSLRGLSQALQRSMGHRLDQHDQRLDRLALRMGRPARLLSDQAAKLNALARHLQLALRHQVIDRSRALDATRVAHRQAMDAAMQRRGDCLDRLALRLGAADPHNVLARGYAWLTDADGKAVTQAKGLKAGTALTAQWTDGSAEVRVLNVASGLPETAS